MKDKTQNLIVGLVLFSILFLLKFEVLNDPYLWDDNAIYYQSKVYLQNNFKPDLGPYYITGLGIDSGHTPLPYELTAFALLTGRPLLVTHLIWLLFSFIGGYYTYKLGSLLFNKKVGIASSLLLMFSPLYFAQTGILNPDILITSLGVVVVYMFLKENFLGYAFWASLLVVAKENGFLVLGGIFVYACVKYFKDKKDLVKKLFIVSIPMFVFVGWLVYHWSFSGSFYISQDRALNKGVEIVLRGIARTHQLFFKNYNWVPGLFIFLSFFNIKQVVKCITKKQIGFLISLVVLSILAMAYIESIIELFSPLVSTRSVGELISKSGTYGVYLISVLALTIIAFAFRKYFSLSLWKDSRMIIFISVVGLYFLVFITLKYSTPRYLLPLYPFFYIAGAASINNALKKYVFIVVIVVLALFVLSWHGNREGQPGYLLEDNMEYRDAIVVHKQMAEYIEKDYPNSIVLTQWPMVNQLRYPEDGFVKKPLTVIDVDHYQFSNVGDFKLNMQDAYRYRFYERKDVKENDVRLYDKLYKSPLERKDFDIFYYSPESQHQAYYRIVDDFNLTLVKRIEYNGKKAELYV